MDVDRYEQNGKEIVQKTKHNLKSLNKINVKKYC